MENTLLIIYHKARHYKHSYAGTHSDDYIPIEEAAQQSGLHINTLKRLLREGVIEGYKAIHQRKRRRMVSVVSLRQYTDPVYGFLLDLPGPKLFLRRMDEEDEED